eukprot:TRINITY_DN385_c0_g2_i3.p1 TRINITY_DN385_c0_g2~~TRINITY_DN385_c0_g2_i3.p1  ORF type:complete len:122 (-),score=25.67 TRINITY_DN385_c0_g2_i3:138-503(-)
MDTSEEIEIEIKFRVDASNKESIFNKLNDKLIHKKVFTDIYYDTVDDYLLTINDTWLRKRDDVWEYKVPYKQISHICTDVNQSNLTKYKEVTNENEIEKYIKTKLLKIEENENENENKNEN